MNGMLWFTTPAGGQLGVHASNCAIYSAPISKLGPRAFLLKIVSTNEQFKMNESGNEDTLDEWDDWHENN